MGSDAFGVELQMNTWGAQTTPKTAALSAFRVPPGPTTPEGPALRPQAIERNPH